MNLAAYIDHTLLRPDATQEQILSLCAEAKAYNFAAVCVPPCYVKTAKEALAETSVNIASVIGFPLGYSLTDVKFFETHKALAHGASEIDMVINVAAFKSGHFSEVQDEIEQLSTLCHFKNAVLKVIVETALLTEKELVQVCEMCAVANVDYVKTSTGFASRGAGLRDVEIMRANLPENIKIKASGGIKTREFALELIAAGANRLGTSSGIALMQD
ncbi:deoxyribose-phosphate aldolase [Adhaeribacter sp. BT258]|uniref:Deoxyribose-phosphate aldolase n=1 Tax=Adhaeribacter terrigena TaxID=2793070 RepID=A0ABS1BWF3_9BACT|nr:deoxyribose-phosphate aldolase [Adhaeribacter terrigena]MBK0401449.1 deoxyribose-phosphate aldolase [Adhaeribacter terrigena]